MTMLPTLPDPSSSTIALMHEGCRNVEAWMAETDDVALLDEARHWLSAVETYLSHKQAEGPAQTTARLLEARIGALLPRGERGGTHPTSVATNVGIGRTEASEFRLMAEHEDVWRDKLPLPRKRVLRIIRDDLADLREVPEVPTSLECSIFEGDFRETLTAIPDESIDLILTDPPYPGEFLPLWSDLARFAKRKLSPNGMLAAMSGQFHLPEVYQRLGENLDYRWTMAYLMNGAANVVQSRRVSTMWKPVLVYGASTRRLHDVATSKAADKDFHGWGQSESGMYDLLRLLAEPGDLVCDPFLGGGTTGVVARAHGCHFVGAEIDPNAFKVAEKRLA